MSTSQNPLSRRRFLRLASATGGACLIPSVTPVTLWAQQITHLGDGELRVLSDGHLQLPRAAIIPAEDQADLTPLLRKYGMTDEQLTPDCNITLWQQADRKVLFDVGAGPNFMPSAGKLLDALSEADIDPADITDVVFTHAHPDHLWGLIDDFDELLCPNATHHMAATEWDYWMDDGTLAKTPEARQSFVAGAQNRLPIIEESVNLFKPGQEILPGIEAINTNGHTPGHTAFAIHNGSESISVIGDALLNVVISFARPQWPSPSDQNPEQAAQTRQKLLDRLTQDKSRIVGFHLPHPGVGMVERSEKAYRFVADI